MLTPSAVVLPVRGVLLCDDHPYLAEHLPDVGAPRRSPKGLRIQPVRRYGHVRADELDRHSIHHPSVQSCGVSIFPSFMQCDWVVDLYVTMQRSMGHQPPRARRALPASRISCRHLLRHDCRQEVLRKLYATFTRFRRENSMLS